MFAPRSLAIPVVALLGMRYDALGLGHLFAATALRLVFYPYTVWVPNHSGWAFADHLRCLALFLAAPMLVFLSLEAGRWVTQVAGRRSIGGWRAAEPR